MPRPSVLAQLAALLAAGRLEIPIAKVFPLAEVRDIGYCFSSGPRLPRDIDPS
jgi:hypothetical protein